MTLASQWLQWSSLGQREALYLITLNTGHPTRAPVQSQNTKNSKPTTPAAVFSKASLRWLKAVFTTCVGSDWCLYSSGLGGITFLTRPPWKSDDCWCHWNHKCWYLIQLLRKRVMPGAWNEFKSPWVKTCHCSGYFSAIMSVLFWCSAFYLKVSCYFADVSQDLGIIFNFELSLR